MSGMVALSTLLMVLLVLFLCATWLACIAWVFPMQNGPYDVLPIGILGGDIDKVVSGIRLITTKLVYERLICGAVVEGAHNIGAGGIGQLIPF